MQTPQEIGTFQRQDAEVPHAGVAIELIDGDLDVERHDGSMRHDDADFLVGRAKAGDCAALDRLLVALRPRAMATALGVLRNSDDAEDAVQEALVKIWRGVVRFEGRSSFSTWVHRVVRNASLDLLRRNGNHQESPAQVECGVEAVVEQASERTPESDFAAREMDSLVRNAIAALPSLHRQAVELRELEECSYQEMAAIIQCPVGTVMSRLHHARRRLAFDLRQPCADAFALAAA